MSSNEADPFDSDGADSPFDKKSESSEQPMRFKRLNRNAVDSDEELFDKVEQADIPKKPQAKQFAKKLMKMFYDGDDEERPKKKKKEQKVVKGKQTQQIKLKRLSKPDGSEQEGEPKKQEEGENHNPQQIPGEEGNDKPSKRVRKAKRRKNSLSGDSESSVSDSVSMVPSSQPDDSAEYSYSGPRRQRESKRQRLRKKNAEKLKEWQLKFSVQEKDDDVQPVADGQAYYTGMEFNYNFAPKRDKNAVKSRNKLFGQFQLTQPEGDTPREVEPTKEQVDQLDIKVKEVPTKSIMEFRFLNKLNASRKARMDKPEIKIPVVQPQQQQQAPPPLRTTNSETQIGDAQILEQSQSLPPLTLERTMTETSIAVPFNSEEHSMRLSQQRKAKQSLMKMVTSEHISHHDNVEFELAVSIPYLARGRSSEVLNNTIYLKKLSSSQNLGKPDEQQTVSSQPLQKSVSTPLTQNRRKKTLSRSDFMASMVNEIRMRRSKFLSLDDIKESFKKTDLEELQLARQRLDKKKNEVMEDIMGEDKEDSDYQPSEASKASNLEQFGPEGETEGNKGERVLADQDFKKLIGLDADADQLQIEQKPEEEDEEDEANEEQNPKTDQGAEKIEEPIAEKQEKKEVQVEDIEKEPQNEMRQITSMEIEQEEQSEQLPKKKQKRFDYLDEALEEENADDIVADNESEQESEGHEEVDSADRDFIKEDDEQYSNSEPKPTPSKSITPGLLLLKDNKQSMGMFKKLKNLAVKVMEKKQRKQEAMKRVNELLDEEAELGSDNEDNDNRKKAIDYEAENKQYEGEDLDADLEQLIDNAPYLFNEEDQEQAYQRFLRDQRMQEKEELMRVIKGEFRKSKKQFMEGMESDHDERQRQERMEQMIKRYKQQDEADAGLYYKRNSDEQSEPFRQPEQLDEQEQNDFAEFYKNGLQRRQSQVSNSQKSNPLELSIFSQPKSNSLGSGSLLIGLKNRSSLLSVASDKSRICSFEQAKLESSKTIKASNLNKLYKKNVMASRSSAVMLGLKRGNSLKVDQP